MELKVIIKNVYGKRLIYPACDKSKLFTDLMNKKTLTDKDIIILKKLDYTITVETPTL